MKYMTRAATYEHKARERMRALRGETVKPVGEHRGGWDSGACVCGFHVCNCPPAPAFDPSAVVAHNGAWFNIDSLGYVTAIPAEESPIVGTCIGHRTLDDGRIVAVIEMGERV